MKPTPRVSQPGTTGVSEVTLQTLFDAEESGLLRYAFGLTGRRAVAEEIVQEVFLRLHVQWDEVEQPKAWLYRSVRNRALNHVRDHRREILSSGDDNGQTRGNQDDSPESLVLRMEAAGMLRQLIEELGETDRQIVKLKYFENLKYREISQRTGLSVSNVGYRLHHILKELAGKLRPILIGETE